MDLWGGTTDWAQTQPWTEDTLVRVLLHKSGLPGFGRTVTFLEMANYDNAIHLLEDAELWYEPGTVSCYHPFTFGYLLAEPIRRITGVPFDEFFHRELAEPLGAEFHFRLTSADDSTRVAQLWGCRSVSPLAQLGISVPVAETDADRTVLLWCLAPVVPVVRRGSCAEPMS